MSENDRTRASVTATVDEIVQGHDALGIPVDEREFCEAYAIIARLEARIMAARNAAEPVA